MNVALYIREPYATAFWRNLMNVLWGDPNCSTTHGLMSSALIAEHLGISEDVAEAYLRRCAQDDLNLTERQGGAWVV